eukprot:3836572-Amphidinium_carterae.1
MNNQKNRRNKEVNKYETLGERSEDVATSLNEISVIYQKQGQLDLALQYAQESVEIYKETIGEGHAYVATSYNNIGEVLRAQGKYDLALESFLQSLQMLRASLGL